MSTGFVTWWQERRIAASETLRTIRSRLDTSLAAPPEPQLRLENAPAFPVILSEELRALKPKLQTRTAGANPARLEPRPGSGRWPPTP